MRGSWHWCPCVLRPCSTKQGHIDPSSSGSCAQPKAALPEGVVQLFGHMNLYSNGVFVVRTSTNWEIKRIRKNEKQQWARGMLSFPKPSLSELQGPFPCGSVTWRDFAKEFIRVFSLHLQFQHLGDIASLQHWPLVAETRELRKLCSRSQIGKLSTRVNTSNLLMSCTNIYGAISSPSGRQRASKPANLWHGIYWQKCIILLHLRRKLGAAAWGRDVWAESSAREREPEGLLQQFPNTANQGTARCASTGTPARSQALGSAVARLHCPSSRKLHWLWEEFEKRFQDPAGNPAKLHPLGMDACSVSWTCCPGYLTEIPMSPDSCSIQNFSDFGFPAKVSLQWKLMVLSSGNAYLKNRGTTYL